MTTKEKVINIFFTSPCPLECAKNLDTKRVNKMILESCQMLSTAINENGGVGIYKSTHKNHPSTKWATESYENWMWLWKHMISLGIEYKKRRGKVHKSFKTFVLSDIRNKAECLLPKKGLTDFPNCAANKELGISYKHHKNVHTAYMLYLNARWDNDKREPTWS